ncbi:MAG: hypothetical protein EOP89_13670 [Lysobacteraceae bacterium]|nr:MAG: hypothetical protein EOP89_13670 [Xanthomonadaceae bacterium]
MATAQPTNMFQGYGATALSEGALDNVRGTASPYAPLSQRNFAGIADVQARSDFRQYGSVARIQMDVWWGTIGSELIANAARANP